MKKEFYIIILLITIGALFVWSLFNGYERVDESNKLKVAATVFPLADIAQNIGGEKVEVINIVRPGASPHTFELNPSDVVRLQGTTLLFAIGPPLDNWTSDILAMNDNVKLIKVDKDIEKKLFKFEHAHEHEDEESVDHKAEEHVDELKFDPHYWLSVQNAKIISVNIANSLIEADPQNADYYKNNLQIYQTQLDEADVEIRGELENLQNNKMIVFHDSWNYFASEYGLDVVGVIQFSPGKESTPQQLANLYDQAVRYNLKAIFSEPQLSPEIVRPFVEDLNLKLYVLDPLGGIDTRDSLIKLLKYNAQTIKQALQ
jgi:zinc transport system substrate-binding protein